MFKSQINLYKCLNPVQLFRSWVYDEAGAAVERATNRVGLLTALETKSLPHLSTSEAFQIVNYGIGGMYHPHHDFLVSHIFGWVLEICFAPLWERMFSHLLLNWL